MQQNKLKHSLLAHSLCICFFSLCCTHWTYLWTFVQYRFPRRTTVAAIVSLLVCLWKFYKPPKYTLWQTCIGSLFWYSTPPLIGVQALCSPRCLDDPGVHSLAGIKHESQEGPAQAHIPGFICWRHWNLWPAWGWLVWSKVFSIGVNPCIKPARLSASRFLLSADLLLSAPDSVSRFLLSAVLTFVSSFPLLAVFISVSRFCQEIFYSQQSLFSCQSCWLISLLADS